MKDHEPNRWGSLERCLYHENAADKFGILCRSNTRYATVGVGLETTESRRKTTTTLSGTRTSRNFWIAYRKVERVVGLAKDSCGLRVVGSSRLLESTQRMYTEHHGRIPRKSMHREGTKQGEQATSVSANGREFLVAAGLVLLWTNKKNGKRGRSLGPPCRKAVTMGPSKRILNTAVVHYSMQQPKLALACVKMRAINKQVIARIFQIAIRASSACDAHTPATRTMLFSPSLKNMSR